ncbi:uncharacterized protein [Branchiostoma lanceolatum]|uniref:uncharacterized protein isoform X2 n=1 Tax=Branchiostoma lanceolatum TaxID=7740 RepID=UPI003451B81D
MVTEKPPIDSDGYFSRRRGHGNFALASLVQLLTACMSVIIIVLVIQEGARLRERVAVQGREIEELSTLKDAVSDYQKKVVDYDKQVAAMNAQREVEVTFLKERLQALEAKIQTQCRNQQEGPGKSGVGHRVKRVVNSVTWPAGYGAGACLQGPPGIPGRDGRDGMPGRDCPCGSNKDVDECASNNGGCAQNCTNTVGSFVCSCRDGFVLNSDGLSCDDVDECAANNGGCYQNCTNTVGSFFCSCGGDYVSNTSGLAGGALPSCKAYITAGLSHGDGQYIVQPDPYSESFSVYCDQTTLGGGWMRFYYKDGPNTCHNYQGITWTGCIIDKIGATDFLVSDDITTGNTDQSWLFRGFGLKSLVCYNSPCSSYATLEDLYGINTLQGVANLGNCRTPSGSQWSQGYTGSYVFLNGTLETLGSWTKMRVGCNHPYTYAAVGQVTKIRFGGGPYHSGEFVHSSCNAYAINYQNSITSRWNTNNVRVMWIR